jgi:hypothetical protein
MARIHEVPGNTTFSRAFTFLSKRSPLEKTLDGIVAMSHKGVVVYQASWNSTAISAREKAVKKEAKKAPRG